jgi:hypothetical protein
MFGVLVLEPVTNEAEPYVGEAVRILNAVQI